MKRRFGDRNDGYRLRKADPFFRIIPHIMKRRSDAQVFFSETVYLEKPQQVIRQLRKEGYKVGFLHVVIASIVRTMSQKPKINRFVRGKKTYARNEICVSLAIKKEMSSDAEETTINVTFDPKDTIYDVCDKINKEIEQNKMIDESNDTDKFAKLFSYLPGFIVTFLMGFIKFMDNRGLLPKFLIKLSPFHTSAFITDLGSLGIKPVYHHVYDFGTTSIFVAFGTRTKEQVIDDDLSVSHKKKMDIKVVVDERIVDGYYFASALKLALKLMNNPELLLLPPDNVVEDNEI